MSQQTAYRHDLDEGGTDMATGAATQPEAHERDESPRLDHEARLPTWLVVARRETGVKLRDRGFLFSTLAILVIIAGSMGLATYLGSTSDQITIAVEDRDGAQIVTQADTAADRAQSGTELTATNHNSSSAVEQAVRSGETDAGLVRTPEGWSLIGKTERNSDVATWVGAAVTTETMAANARAAGTDLEQLTQGSTVGYKVLETNGTSQAVGYASTYAFGFLFYLAAVLLGVALATSIVEEKQNRIVEIIAGSARLRDLLVGKVTGVTLLAVGQMVLFAAAGVVALVVSGNRDMLNQVSPGVGWFLLFFLVGIAALASIYAAAGSLSARSEDIQSTTTPITMIVALVFIAGIAARDGVAEVLSFVPLTASIIMPARIVSGGVAWWEPVVSLALSLLMAALVIRLSERVYRRALLQTGGKLSWRQATTRNH